MKVLIDTNILASAAFSSQARVARVVDYVAAHHELYLTEQIVEELKKVILLKAPHKMVVVEQMLWQLRYRIIPAAADSFPGKMVRDLTDQPILNASISADVDLILTNDKDFLALGLDRPRCVSLREFIDLEKGRPGFVI